MTRKIPILSTIIVAAAIATMIGLGVWQLRRADWKEGLIAQYSQAQTMSSAVPWPRTDADLEHSLFRWSQFDCQRVLSMRTTAATATDGSKGVAQIARCAIDGGGEAEVSLGWSLPTQPFNWQGGEVSGVIAPHGILHVAKPVEGLKALAPPDPKDLPNNHLMYAGQWFFFALTALVIYVLALRRRQS
ncbi:MAG: SURF1 family protein [Porphyrobacter sp.]|nr:SURF1 family protein [Porphyrobacter sp.]